jgi:hypothetical protein
MKHQNNSKEKNNEVDHTNFASLIYGTDLVFIEHAV